MSMLDTIKAWDYRFQLNRLIAVMPTPSPRTPRRVKPPEGLFCYWSVSAGDWVEITSTVAAELVGQTVLTTSGWVQFQHRDQYRKNGTK